MKMMERKAYTAFGETGRHQISGFNSTQPQTVTRICLVLRCAILRQTG